MPPVIRVENLGKRYYLHQTRRQGSYRTLRESLVDLAAAPVRRWRNGGSTETREAFWALDNVSFEVQPGEVVGIIGRNGAGKSTLLKILSRITRPTTGRVGLRGRVGSLLEVGTGFHPELTGRENVYLNGAILGMTRREIDRRFDEIVAFAEIERFLDTPVKRYSSGMYVRLAFAVAAHLEPEILVVDEVLAVGDAAFQSKCLKKMEQTVRTGRTILFVSHNMAAISHLCNNAILLDKGKVVFSGDAPAGIREYIGVMHEHGDGVLDLSEHSARRHGCVPVLRKVRLLNAKGLPQRVFSCGEPLVIEFEVEPSQRFNNPHIGIGFEDWMGTRVFSVATYLSRTQLPPIHEPHKVTCGIAEINLVPGRYSLSLSAGNGSDKLMDAIDHAVSFEVEPGDFYGNGKVPPRGLGQVLVRSDWATSVLSSRDDDKTPGSSIA